MKEAEEGIHLDSLERDMLMVAAVIAHMVAQGDIVEPNDLAIMQRAVLWPVHRHSPTDGGLSRRHWHACSALGQLSIIVHDLWL